MIDFSGTIPFFIVCACMLACVCPMSMHLKDLACICLCLSVRIVTSGVAYMTNLWVQSNPLSRGVYFNCMIASERYFCFDDVQFFFISYAIIFLCHIIILVSPLAHYLTFF